MSIRSKIQSSRYAYIYFETAQELYSVSPFKLIGNFKSVNDLIKFDVKSWKQYNVAYVKDIHEKVDESEKDDWYILQGHLKTQYALKAYLGLK